MSKFIVRVELHFATEAVYEQLHKMMAAAGYYRQITAGDGTLYHLPSATYEQAFSQNLSATQIHDHVKPIVEGVWKHSAILATKYEEAAWSGLNTAARKAA